MPIAFKAANGKQQMQHRQQAAAVAAVIIVVAATTALAVAWQCHQYQPCVVSGFSTKKTK